jgi:hypothetical protein
MTRPCLAMMTRPRLAMTTRAGVAMSALFLLGGCSSFEHRWREARIQRVPTEDLLGRWQGSWSSAVTGHSGRLRCIVRPMGEDAYEARYRATYAGFLTFDQTVRMRARHVTDRWEFTGEADLGWLAGGLYRYEGHADGTRYFSTYASSKDHGVFEMTRPEATSP